MDYYGSLGLEKTASQQQIKQAYKKLALKHHPDKNQDKEAAKIKFTQITEAYTVLNNPQKKAYYDKYGIAQSQMQEFSDFEHFMGDFNFFEDFLDDLLMFDNIKQWQKMMKTMNKKGKKKGRGRGGKRKKTKDMNEQDLLNAMMMGMNMDDGQLDKNLLSQMMNGDVGQQQLALLEAMMGGAQMDLQFEQMMMGMLGGTGKMKNKKKSSKKQQVQNEDEDWQLTPQQLQILQFGKKNIQTVKKGSKKSKVCKFDNEKVKQEDILAHFSEKHRKEFQQSIKKQQIK